MEAFDAKNLVVILDKSKEALNKAINGLKKLDFITPAAEAFVESRPIKRGSLEQKKKKIVDV